MTTYLYSKDIAAWERAQGEINSEHVNFVGPTRDTPTESLHYTCGLFNKIKGNVIVECGSGLHGEQSGNSMLHWFHDTGATKIHCIEIDPHCINTVKNTLGEDPRIIYHPTDCFKTIPTIPSIDLLYMDFLVNGGANRAEAYLKLYLLCKKGFFKKTGPKLILIDDTDHVDPWKQTLVVPQALKDGYMIVCMGRQTLLARDDIAQEVLSLKE